MKKNINKYFIKVFLILTSLVAGCQNPNLNTKGETLYPKSHRVFWNYGYDGVILSTDEMPKYDIGDAFLYDNGEIEIVVESYGKIIKWFKPNNSFYVSHQNVFLPFLKEEIINETEEAVTTENHFKIKENFLWPPRVGLYDEFDVKEIRSDNNFINQFEYKWSCLVLGDETIKVAENKFDVFVVECKKTRFNFIYEKQILYYSPEIGRFAKIIKKQGSAPDEVHNITAYGLAPNAMPDNIYKSLINLVQYALETRISGNNIIRKEQDVLMEIKPLKSFKTDEGYFCREYEQKLIARGRRSIQKSIACRDKKGIWKTPIPKDL